MRPFFWMTTAAVAVALFAAPIFWHASGWNMAGDFVFASALVLLLIPPLYGIRKKLAWMVMVSCLILFIGLYAMTMLTVVSDSSQYMIPAFATSIVAGLHLIK